MASLLLRSAARVFRRSISNFAAKTQPTKHFSSEFNVGHTMHIQQEKSTCLAWKVEERGRLLRRTREHLKVILQQKESDEAWDKLQKTVILPSLALVGLGIWANKMLFGESRQEMPEETRPPN